MGCEVGRRITGRVFSDLGRGASFMRLDWVQKALRKILGFSPYPGTLNLRLETEQAVATWREIREEVQGIEVAAPEPSFCRARCFPVEIEGRVRGAAILPEVEGYPADKLEVVASVRLKDELRLADGGRVTIEFRD